MDFIKLTTYFALPLLAASVMSIWYSYQALSNQNALQQMQSYDSSLLSSKSAGMESKNNA